MEIEIVIVPIVIGKLPHYYLQYTIYWSICKTVVPPATSIWCKLFLLHESGDYNVNTTVELAQTTTCVKRPSVKVDHSSQARNVLTCS